MKYLILSFILCFLLFMVSCKSENRYESYYIEPYDDNAALWGEKGGIVVIDKETGKYYRITSEGYSRKAESENYYSADSWVKGKTYYKEAQQSRIVEVNPLNQEVIIHNTKVKLGFKPDQVAKQLETEEKKK